MIVFCDFRTFYYFCSANVGTNTPMVATVGRYCGFVLPNLPQQQNAQIYHVGLGVADLKGFDFCHLSGI